MLHVRGHPSVFTTTGYNRAMRFVPSLETIWEGVIYKDPEEEEETVEAVETFETRRISIDSIDSILPVIQRDRYCTRDVYGGSFMEKMSGKGIIVKKCTGRYNGLRYRRLYIMGKYMYLSSVFNTKEIAINEVGYVKNRGKNMAIETSKHGVLNLKMPLVTDALALRRALGVNY